jgi:hypothetical protein
MANGVAIRPGFIWTNGTAVLSSELSALDAAQVDAMRGSGGVWVPTTTIEIQGAQPFYAHTLRGGNVGSGIAAFAAAGTAVGTNAASTFTVGGSLVANGSLTLGGTNSAPFVRTGSAIKTFSDQTVKWLPIPGRPGVIYGGTFLSPIAFTATNTRARALLFLSPNVTYTSFKVRYFGGGGGTHSALPATKTSFQLFSRNENAAEANQSALIVDPSATVGAYESFHLVTIPCNFRPTSANLYLLEIVSESGANSLAQGEVLDVLASGTVDRYGASPFDGTDS